MDRSLGGHGFCGIFAVVLEYFGTGTFQAPHGGGAAERKMTGPSQSALCPVGSFTPNALFKDARRGKGRGGSDGGDGRFFWMAIRERTEPPHQRTFDLSEVPPKSPYQNYPIE